MARFVVIGLGTYGQGLAAFLAAAGEEVIAIDRDINRVEEIKEKVQRAVRLDGTNIEALKTQKVDQVDCAIVCIGENFEANELTVMALKEIGVPRIISRCSTSIRAVIMEALGVDLVISPLIDNARMLGRRLLLPGITEYVEFSHQYCVIHYPLPPQSEFKTVSELKLDGRQKITLLGVARQGESGRKEDVEIIFDTPPDFELSPGDTLVISGLIDSVRDYVERLYKRFT